MAFDRDTGGGGTGAAWTTIAEGDVHNVADALIEPGASYALTITAPVALPSWLEGALFLALQGLGLSVQKVSIAGSTIRALFNRG